MPDSSSPDTPLCMFQCGASATYLVTVGMLVDAPMCKGHLPHHLISAKVIPVISNTDE